MHSNCSKMRNWPDAPKPNKAAGEQAKGEEDVEDKNEYYYLVLTVHFKIRTTHLIIELP